MNKRITLIGYFLISAMLTMLIAPITMAHAEGSNGSLTIYNDNCTKTVGFKKYKRVTVHVYDPSPSMDDCTNTYVTVGMGSRKTIELIPDLGENTRCDYRHEAKGTAWGDQDVRGDRHSSVTCKKDRIKVCQCKKD